MLNAWVYFCGATDQWSIHPADPRNVYIPKQMSFSYLSHSISRLNNHLHKLLVDLILYDCRFQICLAWFFSLCQLVSGSIHKNDLSQKNWETSDLSKGIYIYGDHKKSEWGVVEICHVFADSIVFKQLIYCSFLQTVGKECKKLSFFVDVIDE